MTPQLAEAVLAAVPRLRETFARVAGVGVIATNAKPNASGNAVGEGEGEGDEGAGPHRRRKEKGKQRKLTRKSTTVRNREEEEEEEDEDVESNTRAELKVCASTFEAVVRETLREAYAECCSREGSGEGEGKGEGDGEGQGQGEGERIGEDWTNPAHVADAAERCEWAKIVRVAGAIPSESPDAPLYEMVDADAAVLVETFLDSFHVEIRHGNNNNSGNGVSSSESSVLLRNRRELVAIFRMLDGGGKGAVTLEEFQRGCRPVARGRNLE